MVFSDAVAGSFDSASSSPPPRSTPSYRPRTHTMDGATAFREPLGHGIGLETRHRVGSFSSSGSLPLADGLRGPPLQPPPLESLGYPSVTPATASTRPHELQIASGSAASKEKKSASRRLIKRASSRPTSPLISLPPSVDSLPLPIPTDDANKVLLLMKTLCGRMRGALEYQAEPGGPWYTGTCYIEEEKGSLMLDPGESGPFPAVVVPDLRGCRVLPVDRPDKDGRCLELVNSQTSVEVTVRPLAPEEFDLWLAALLCWQQLRPGTVKVPSARSPVSPTSERQHDTKRRGSAAKSKDAGQRRRHRAEGKPLGNRISHDATNA